MSYISLKFLFVFTDWVKWLIPACNNLRKLHLIDIGPRPYADSDVIREISRLTQLNELAMTVKDKSALNMVTLKCKQVRSIH